MLTKTIKYSYIIECKSGLHIGGNSSTFDIGGADSTVIKDPLTNEPYIPGSSIKGKMRNLLRWKYEDIEENNLTNNNELINQIFGTTDENAGLITITRAIFRDAYLTEDSKNVLSKNLGAGIYTEVKAENAINPIKGKALSPRFIERVVAGSKFGLEIVLNIFDGDDEQKLVEMVEEGVKLIEANYIGGSGSRGYGKVVMSLESKEEI